MTTGNNTILGGGGLHHIAIRTTDLEKSIAFYTGVLGMTVRVRFALGAMKFAQLDTGDGSLLELAEDDQPVNGADERNAHWHLCLRCSRIAEVLAAVEAAGYAVTKPETDVDLINTAHDPPTGFPVKIAFFTGPSGESVELLQELKA